MRPKLTAFQMTGSDVVIIKLTSAQAGALGQCLSQANEPLLIEVNDALQFRSYVMNKTNPYLAIAEAALTEGNVARERDLNQGVV